MLHQLQDLNFLHLFYFWMVARHGGITLASERLHLTQPTVSTQIRKLEKSLGGPLFIRAGRELELTATGKLVFEYAEEMFAVGRELLGALRGVPAQRGALRLHVGVPQVLPKAITYHLLEPVLHFPEPLQIIVSEGPVDHLVAELMRHQHDVILSDSPLPPGRVQTQSHLLGQCGVGLCASRELAARLQRRFPQSLSGAPLLLPAANTELRRSIDRWLDERGLTPRIVAEVNDSALLHRFGQGGAGVFPAPLCIVDELKQELGVELVGQFDNLQLQFFAITLQRKLAHPAVVAIAQAAGQSLPAMAAG